MALGKCVCEGRRGRPGLLLHRKIIRKKPKAFGMQWGWGEEGGEETAEGGVSGLERPQGLGGHESNAGACLPQRGK